MRKRVSFQQIFNYRCFCWIEHFWSDSGNSVYVIKSITGRQAHLFRLSRIVFFFKSEAKKKKFKANLVEKMYQFGSWKLRVHFSFRIIGIDNAPYHFFGISLRFAYFSSSENNFKILRMRSQLRSFYCMVYLFRSGILIFFQFFGLSGLFFLLAQSFWHCFNLTEDIACFIVSLSGFFMQSSQSTMFCRLEWLPDGTYLIAPCANNNAGPTAQLIRRKVCAVIFRHIK